MVLLASVQQSAGFPPSQRSPQGGRALGGEVSWGSPVPAWGCPLVPLAQVTTLWSHKEFRAL